VSYHTQSLLTFANISGKKVQADFDAGTLSSDGGVLFLRPLEAQMEIIKRLSQVLVDRRHQSYVDHPYEDLMRQRVFQIACGYEDANDCDVLRHDPAFKAACHRLPLSGEPLGSQPTMSRLENSVGPRDLYRMTRALVDLFLDSYPRAPKAILLDIDDTNATTHGDQQLALFNAHYGDYGYQPLHLYEGQSGKLITTLLRPGHRPSGKQIVAILKRLVSHIRARWPKVQLLLRGDSHFSAPEVHKFCETHSEAVYYVLGQSGNAVLKAKANQLVAQAQTLYRLQQARHMVSEEAHKIRLFTDFHYQANSWHQPRRIICKVEVSSQGLNVRFVVTNLTYPRPQQLYDLIYCGRGQMENFIKNHKTFLQSDRTSCHTFLANAFRLILHSAAYVLLHAFAEKGLAGTQWSHSQFNIVQLRLLKVAVKVTEMATKIKFHFPSSCPLQSVYVKIMANLTGAAP
jgi:Transposase DDE domain group 1